MATSRCCAPGGPDFVCVREQKYLKVAKQDGMFPTAIGRILGSSKFLRFHCAWTGRFLHPLEGVKMERIRAMGSRIRMLVKTSRPKIFGAGSPA